MVFLRGKANVTIGKLFCQGGDHHPVGMDHLQKKVTKLTNLVEQLLARMNTTNGPFNIDGITLPKNCDDEDNCNEGSGSTTEMIPTVPTFRLVLNKDSAIPVGWRRASVREVTTYNKEARVAMKTEEWGICRLTDGIMKGPGYGYVIVSPPNVSQSTIQNRGHQLIVKFGRDSK